MSSDFKKPNYTSPIETLLDLKLGSHIGLCFVKVPQFFCRITKIDLIGMHDKLTSLSTWRDCERRNRLKEVVEDFPVTLIT